jgi:hypothetical protein
MSVAATSGRYKKVLLIGTDKMSSIVDYTNRSTVLSLVMVLELSCLSLIEELGLQMSI